VSVFQKLRLSDAMSHAELSEALDLSRPTVVGAVQQLESMGWLTAEAPRLERGRTGRPAARYRFNRQAAYVLGLDIGAHTIRSAVGDLVGDVIQFEEFEVSESADAETRLQRVRGAISASLDKAHIKRGDLVAASAGTVGVVDDAGRVTISTVIPQWDGLNLASWLKRSLGCPVRVETDARLAALAEYWRGSGVGADKLVYIHVGHRIGSGILIDGAVYRGANGASGEIGALEAIGWSKALDSLHAVAPSGAMRERLARDDRATARLVDGFATTIAPGVAALILVLDPDCVVIGGGLSGLGQRLSEPIVKHLSGLCLRVPEVRTSTLGTDGVVVGAIRDALVWADQNVFTAAPPTPAS
jgi:predicted NBD/HSP70 family sugar kinase